MAGTLLAAETGPQAPPAIGALGRAGGPRLRGGTLLAAETAQQALGAIGPLGRLGGRLWGDRLRNSLALALRANRRAHLLAVRLLLRLLCHRRKNYVTGAAAPPVGSVHVLRARFRAADSPDRRRSGLA